MNRILISIAFNRKNSRGFTLAKLVPLRFKDGSNILKYNNKRYTMPRIVNNGISLLYIIYFYSPKFFDLPPIEKLRVIFHELYHISPEFNGDIRRLGRVKAAHGASKKKYNIQFEKELQQFYSTISETQIKYFLDLDTNLLRKNYQNIYCRRMKLPKPIAL